MRWHGRRSAIPATRMAIPTRRNTSSVRGKRALLAAAAAATVWMMLAGRAYAPGNDTFADVDIAEYRDAPGEAQAEVEAAPFTSAFAFGDSDAFAVAGASADPVGSSCVQKGGYCNKFPCGGEVRTYQCSDCCSNTGLTCRYKDFNPYSAPPPSKKTCESGYYRLG